MLYHALFSYINFHSNKILKDTTICIFLLFSHCTYLFIKTDRSFCIDVAIAYTLYISIFIQKGIFTACRYKLEVSVSNPKMQFNCKSVPVVDRLPLSAVTPSLFHAYVVLIEPHPMNR